MNEQSERLAVRRVKDKKQATKWEYQDNGKVIVWFNRRTVQMHLHNLEIQYNNKWVAFSSFRESLQNVFNDQRFTPEVLDEMGV